MKFQPIPKLDDSFCDQPIMDVLNDVLSVNDGMIIGKEYVAQIMTHIIESWRADRTLLLNKIEILETQLDLHRAFR